MIFQSNARFSIYSEKEEEQQDQEEEEEDEDCEFRLLSDVESDQVRKV